MPPRTHDEIRQAFLDYFAAHEHRVVSSYNLVPPDDPTLLFVNAGMVQFKDVFTGMKQVPYARAATTQKCLRVSGKHNDLENVGRTARHHTFFEMLGNFSFGDYFKEDAIRFGWELMVDHLGLPAEKMWVSVHPDDDEARTLWRDVIGVPANRVVDDPDNFWSMGDTGPCGPCSEIHIDQGPARPGWEKSTFGDGSDRYLELWNLVFMQFERHPDGSMTPLPSPSIDTGMGLERIVAVVGGHTSNYDSDLFRPLIGVVEDSASRTYGSDEDFDTACRVLADHARAAAFLVADGVYPSNEGRGYVLRRLLRRAIRFGRTIGLEGPSVSAVADRVVDIMSAAWPALVESRGVIERILTLEEERFGRTLADGERLLNRAMAEVTEAGRARIAGDVAFTLHDTHGFPLDLTELIVAEHGLSVDREGFDACLAAQRERSRAETVFAQGERNHAFDALVETDHRSEFVGYETERGAAKVALLVRDGEAVERLEPGERGEVVLDRTPFYAESGGQVGDVGQLVVGAKAAFSVENTLRYGDAVIRHLGAVPEGSPGIGVGEAVEAAVSHEARTATRANHSATHLLHHALRDVLGDHVRQRGSLVAPDRLRFDFSHFEPLSATEIEEIETRVNAMVRANDVARTDVLPFDEAVAGGAIAFFDEKYGDEVRVLRIGASVELCGGTHVRRAGDIGLVTILSEGSVQSGVRRIEARAGAGAVAHLQETRAAARAAARRLNSGINDLPAKVENLLKTRRELEKELERAASAQAAGAASTDDLGSVDGIAIRALHLEGADRKALLPALDGLREQMKKGIVLVTGTRNDRRAVLLGATDDITDRIHAGNTLKSALATVGGRGGGNARTGQGGLDRADRDTLAGLIAAILDAIRTAA